MFSISHYKSPPSERVLRQIVQITVDNVPALHMVAPEPSNPLYPVYEWALVAEIQIYANRLGDHDPHRGGLVVATDTVEPDRVAGFLIYLEAENDPSTCAICYMAVAADRRRRGIARAMVSEVLSRRPRATLTCAVEKVAYYEAMGFSVAGHRDNQITMTNWEYDDGIRIAVIDPAKLIQTPEVADLHQQLVQKYGLKAIRDAEKKQNRDMARAATKAQAYAAARGAPAPA